MDKAYGNLGSRQTDPVPHMYNIILKLTRNENIIQNSKKNLTILNHVVKIFCCFVFYSRISKIVTLGSRSLKWKKILSQIQTWHRNVRKMFQKTSRPTTIIRLEFENFILVKIALHGGHCQKTNFRTLTNNPKN